MANESRTNHPQITQNHKRITKQITKHSPNIIGNQKTSPNNHQRITNEPSTHHRKSSKQSNITEKSRTHHQTIINTLEKHKQITNES
jgi:hypothetical protein